MGILVVGSRAMRHAFPTARAALDWDVIATPEQADALRRRLPLLPGFRSRTHDKIFLSLDGTPLEVIVAEPGSAWRALIDRPASAAHVEGLGAVAFARPSTLLMMKLVHVHLPMQWDKTADDIDALYTRRVRLDEGDLPLVARLRTLAERWQSHMPVRSPVSHRVHTLLRQRPMPASDEGKTELLSELTMLFAYHESVGPNEAVRELVTRILGREDAIELGPFARAAVRRIPKGFQERFARASSVMPIFSLAKMGTEISVPWIST